MKFQVKAITSLEISTRPEQQGKWEKGQHLNHPPIRITIQDLDGSTRDKCHCYERTQHERSQTLTAYR